MTLAEPRAVAAATVTPSTGDTVAAILDHAVAAHADRPAVGDADGTWTYAELDAAADAVARHLVAAGVRPGDRVALRSRNRRELAAVLYGTARAGAALVPLSPHLTAAGTDDVLSDAAPTAVLLPRAEVTTLPGTVLAIEDVVTGGAGTIPAAPAAGDLVLLIYTSGSTSKPKGVVEPHAAVAFAAQAIGQRLGYRSDDVVLVGSPMSFDYGLYQILLTTLAGAHLVLTDADDPIGMLRTLRSVRATVLPIVPSIGRMLIRLARRGDAIDHVRLFTNTGAALLQADIDGLRATFPGSAVVAMYGITECKRVTIADPDVDRERPGSVGPALPGTTLQILGDDGTPLGPGEIGQIAAVGPHVMAGYWQAPQLSAQRFDTDPVSGRNRLLTGDYGRVDADGHLYFHGRRDDQFKRRGVRMSSLEIEAAAATLPGVGATAVLMPSGEHDLEIAVVGEVTADDVLAGLGALLEPAKVPAACHVLDALPLTPNGKTDGKRLRTLLRPQQGDPA